MLLDDVIHEYLTFIGRDSLFFKLEVHQSNKLNGRKGKRIGGIREINIGLNMGKSNTNTCAEVQSLSKNFFFLISNLKFNKKAQRGATLIHGKYTREPLYRRTN